MKKRVHYSLLEDMKKYMEGFNSKDYEKNGDFTDPSVISMVRNYYDTHLPVDITAWLRVNKPNNNLIYANDQAIQARFVRDVICAYLLFPRSEKHCDNQPLVISTHISKSVKLPVYQINLKKYGLEFVLRCNFYDWKISVNSDKPLECDFMGLFNPAEEVSPYCCEGFPSNKIYGSYNNNHSKFTIELRGEYDVYVFFFLLKKYLSKR